MAALSRFPVLVADIGGTNARFALVTAAGGQPEALKTLACADYPDIVAAMRAYLASAGTVQPVEAIVAIANPVTGDAIRMTNHVWSFSIEQTRQALGLANLRVINDFTALALALPRLGAGGQVQVGGGAVKPRAAIGLIGPGTGLGVSGLVPVGADGWQPLAGEGGHVSFSPVDAEEDAVLALIRRECATVSAERLISGPGLVRLHAALRHLAGLAPQALSPAEISRQALAGTDPHCVKTLDMFCAMLGTAAGNLALTLGAEGGVYIGGGIVPAMLEYFGASRFRERFEAKGRLSAYLAAVPTFVITAANPALIGAAALIA